MSDIDIEELDASEGMTPEQIARLQHNVPVIGTASVLAFVGDVSARIAALTADRDALAAVVAKLPKDGAGQPIAVNDVVWFENIEIEGGPLTSSRIIAIEQRSADRSRFTIECEGGQCMVARDCYSTREAADAARS